MSEAAFEFTAVEGGVPIKMWTRGVPVDDKAREQLASAAKITGKNSGFLGSKTGQMA